MAPKNTRKGGNKSSKGSDQPNSKAETDTEAIAMAKADTDTVSMNSTAEGGNTKRRRVSTTPNEASDTCFASSATVVMANTSAGAAGGEDTSTSGAPNDMIFTTTESHAAKPRLAAVAETARPIAMEVYGDGDAGGKVGGGTGAKHAPPTALPRGLEIIPSEVGVEAVTAVATYESMISSMARANETNIITAENYYLLYWLYRIRDVSCLRGLRISFLQPDFLWSIYRPMMRSKKLLWRTDGDIRVAVDLWCFDRAAAIKRYGHISDWDVSSVTDMSELFQGPQSNFPMQDGYRGKDLFNDDISRWDVSNVTSMSAMFANARAFNRPIGDWDVSNVTEMGGMFFNAYSFNQPVGDWDVSEVTAMGSMFGNAGSFNRPIEDWDVSKVTNMGCMFHGADSFNEPVGDWDVSKVTEMRYMFHGAVSFDQDLTRWDMRSVRHTRNMFRHAHAMQRDNRPATVRDDVYNDGVDDDVDDDSEVAEEEEDGAGV